jgi:hypothetical protein
VSWPQKRGGCGNIVFVLVSVVFFFFFLVLKSLVLSVFMFNIYLV